MKLNRSKSNSGILIIVVACFAMLALVGLWRRRAFDQEGQSTESKPATAPSQSL
jgi:hypothetical protein